jgi:hypothetical protein
MAVDVQFRAQRVIEEGPMLLWSVTDRLFVGGGGGGGQGRQEGGVKEDMRGGGGQGRQEGRGGLGWARKTGGGGPLQGQSEGWKGHWCASQSPQGAL